jgi:hypothetical protein
MGLSSVRVQRLTDYIGSMIGGEPPAHLSLSRSEDEPEIRDTETVAQKVMQDICRAIYKHCSAKRKKANAPLLSIAIVHPATRDKS